MPETPTPPAGGSSPTGGQPPARVLVTSALPYANGRVHIGHLAGAYLPADVYVRYLRARGTDVAFICGSDEHGVPITVAAEKEGVTPKEIIDRYHAANAAAFEAARVEFDFYGRTSSPEHHELTRYFFTRLLEKGHIEKRDTEQLFCERCGRFLPDRYVEGKCHHCGADGARGDQCDACGHVVDALKLTEPECKICGATPSARKATHWFLKLPDFAARLESWIGDAKAWRANVRHGALGWLKEGLRERSITRDLSWGVKVPLDEPDAAGKVIYVWFDAPIGYVTFTQQWARAGGAPERWKDFWRDPETPICHFIGKDNIPFHAITWPAMIMGVGDGAVVPTELPRHVIANEYLNMGRRKFSKSLGLMIGLAEFAREFGPDALRYHITATAPETSDSEFTWDDFRQRYSELADVLGNFCHRGLSFAAKHMGGRFPPVGSLDNLKDADRAVLDEVRRARDEAGEELLRFRFKGALSRVMDLARAGNRHFDSREPWVSRKGDFADCEAAIAASLGVVRGLATLIDPFMPDAASRLRGSLGDAAPRAGAGTWDSAGEGELPAGADLGKPEVLFPKMDDDEFEAKRARAMGGAGFHHGDTESAENGN